MEEKNTKHKIYKAVMLIIVTAFVTFLLTTAVIYKTLAAQGNIPNFLLFNKSSNNSKVITSLEKIISIVDNYYLGEIDENKLIEGTIEGYINGLGDKYTEYITKEEMEDFTNQILGNYVGIGIYMVANEEENRIQVLTPMKESPAEKAGILPGDLIIKVDDIEYTSSDMTLAANNIKGVAGTKVKLEILREGKTLEFELTRSEIQINPIESEILDNKIGYLELSSFDENTAKEFKTKFEELQSKGIKSLIIDLRNNGGGLVSEALQIADYIVEKDSTLLITVDKNGKEEIEKAKDDPIINMPIVILTNEYTASASEILVGALKDNKKATIVGTKTYGKGVIQQLLSLSDGSGLKITIEEYYTPNRNKINKVGIEPDELVELPETIESILSVKLEDDTQLQKAMEILNNK